MVVVSYCRGRPRLVLVNRLEGLSLPENSAIINWLAQHDLVVDWVVKLQHIQRPVCVYVNYLSIHSAAPSPEYYVQSGVSEKAVW